MKSFARIVTGVVLVVAVLACAVLANENLKQRTRIDLLEVQNLELAELLEHRSKLMASSEAKFEAARIELEETHACAAQAAEASPPCVQGRVVDLPEDADKLHTILFVQKDWEKRPNEQKAKRLFDTKDWCLDLRARTHWHFWTIDQAEAKPYWKFITKTPCLMIIDCSGQAGRVLYNEANPDLAKCPTGLLSHINVERKRQRHGQTSPFTGPCPDGVCPKPNPQPDASKDPEDIKTQPAADEEKADEKKPEAAKPEDKGLPLAASLGIVGIVGVLGFVGISAASKTKRVARAYRHRG